MRQVRLTLRPLKLLQQGSEGQAVVQPIPEAQQLFCNVHQLSQQHAVVTAPSIE
ncbi:hypothetical protein HaLaN_02530 [Haematococcus lacustris]|uniref:Uncharacterized protein n=1 Tax=Haematococcus lacustris TaxID=44745 RepID=A0A699YEB7_HAELA|nr:hypothetical protein HaLaN_02530 [Haematococcus lacustris]